MPRFFVALVAVGIVVGCRSGDRQSATSAAACATAADSTRAARVALDTAARLTGQARVVHEFRCEVGGYSILTLPTVVRATDGDLTVRVSRTFVVTGFGPDSA